MIKNPKRELAGLDAALAGLTGASSLLEPPSQTTPATGAPLLVSVANLHPDPAQARRVFDPDKLRELADSIAEHGVIQPIVIQPRDDLQPGHWQILAGERRWRAASLAGLADVPCVLKGVKEGADEEQRHARRLVQQIVENVQREDLTPTELVDGYCRLVDEYGLTAAEIARQVGRSRQMIGEYLAVGRMDETYRVALRNGSVRDVSALVALWRLHDRDPAAADALLHAATPESPIKRGDARNTVSSPAPHPGPTPTQGINRELTGQAGAPTEPEGGLSPAPQKRLTNRAPDQRTLPSFSLRAEPASGLFVGVVSDGGTALHTSAVCDTHVGALLLAVDWLRSYLDQLNRS